MIAGPNIPGVTEVTSVFSGFSSRWSVTVLGYSKIPITGVSVKLPARTPKGDLLFGSSTAKPSDLNALDPPFRETSIDVAPNPPT